VWSLDLNLFSTSYNIHVWPIKAAKTTMAMCKDITILILPFICRLFSLNLQPVNQWMTAVENRALRFYTEGRERICIIIIPVPRLLSIVHVLYKANCWPNIGVANRLNLLTLLLLRWAPRYQIPNESNTHTHASNKHRTVASTRLGDYKKYRLHLQFIATMLLTLHVTMPCDNVDDNMIIVILLTGLYWS